jgi:hypothetical protein
MKAVAADCMALSLFVSWGNMENEGIACRVAGFWKLFTAGAPKVQARYVTAMLTCSVTEL